MQARALSTRHRIALGLVLLLVALFAMRQVGSHDAGFHLAAGESILDGDGWPRTDTFTYTVRGNEYVDTSWGFQIVLAVANRVAGPAGMTGFSVVVAVGIFVLLIGTTRLATADAGSLSVVLLLGAIASEIRFEPRPELVSYLLLALLLHVLQRHAEGVPTPLWPLVPIHLLWANTHSLVILGWGAMGCFVAGLAVRDRRLDGRLLAWCAAAVAIGVVNPYGLRGLLFPLELLTRMQEQNPFAASIEELLSPFAVEERLFYPWLAIKAFQLLLLLAVISIVPLFRSRRFPSLFLLLMFAPLAVALVRNVPLLVIACLPGIVWSLPLAAGLERLRIGEPWRLRWVRGVAIAVAVLAVVLGWRVATDAYYIADRRQARVGFGWNRLILPVDAAAYIDEARPPGRMLNHLGFGGYLIWATDAPVFIDGRLEVIGERFYRYYNAVMASAPALEAAAARHGIGWIIFPYQANPQLLGRLSRDAAWRLAYVDPMCVVFVSATEGAAVEAHESARLARSAAQPLSDLSTLPGFGARPRARGLVRWARGFAGRQSFPTADYRTGQFHYFRGEMAPAASHYAQAIRASDGAYPEIYYNLATTLFYLRRYDEARAGYAVVLDADPGNRFARERLAEIDALTSSGPGPG